MLKPTRLQPAAPCPDHAARLRALRKRLRKMDADSMLVTNLPDVRYLCGFTGSNAALAVNAKVATLFTDGRYTAQAAAETKAANVQIVSGSVTKFAVEWLASKGSRRCFLDTTATTLADFKHLEKIARPLKLKYTMSAGSPVLDLRQTKDAYEIDQMRKAASLGCELYYDVLTVIRSGVTEASIAAHLEHAARMRGVEGMSFPTIVASGQRSSLPHGAASQARLPRRGFCTLDFGVILNGYCSDMTRTVYIGKPLRRHVAAYEAVLAAQLAGVAAVRAGVACGDVDEAARSVLRSAKLDQWFSHSTGHGVGLEIHEPPRIAANSKATLEAGMVITIEPGVYLPNDFGIRIEDTVAVTANGCEILTTAPKGWTALA